MEAEFAGLHSDLQRLRDSEGASSASFQSLKAECDELKLAVSSRDEKARCVLRVSNARDRINSRL